MRTNEIGGYRTTIQVDGFKNHGGVPKQVADNVEAATELLTSTIGLAAKVREEFGKTTPDEVTVTIKISAISKDEAEKMTQRAVEKSVDIFDLLAGLME